MSQQSASSSKLINGISLFIAGNLFIAGAVAGVVLNALLAPSTPAPVATAPSSAAPSQALPLLQVTPTSSMPQQSAGTPPITPDRP